MKTLKELIEAGATADEILKAGGTEKDIETAERIKNIKNGDIVRQEVGIDIKSVDEEKRTLIGIASTEEVDRVGDIIKQDGWDFKNFLKNPVMPWGHNYSLPPVAKILRIWTKGKETWFEAKFAGAEQMHELAETVFRLYKDGFLKAFSVGFSGKEWEPNEFGGVTFKKCELQEISAVTVPCNASALAKAAKMTGIKKEVLEKVFINPEKKGGGKNDDEIESDELDEIELNKRIDEKIKKLKEKLTILEESHEQLKMYRKAFKQFAKLLNVKKDDEKEMIIEVGAKTLASIVQVKTIDKKIKSPEVTPRARLSVRPTLSYKKIEAIVDRVVSNAF